MKRLIYISQSYGLTEFEIDSILERSIINNEKNGITGCLITDGKVFLQLLEGPDVEVSDTFARIRRDKRHYQVEVLICQDTSERLFPLWAMRAKKEAAFKNLDHAKVRELFESINSRSTNQEIALALMAAAS